MPQRTIRGHRWPTRGLSGSGWVAPVPFVREHTAAPDVVAPQSASSADGEHLAPPVLSVLVGAGRSCLQADPLHRAEDTTR